MSNVKYKISKYLTTITLTVLKINKFTIIFKNRANVKPMKF